MAARIWHPKATAKPFPHFRREGASRRARFFSPLPSSTANIVSSSPIKAEFIENHPFGISSVYSIVHPPPANRLCHPQHTPRRRRTTLSKLYVSLPPAGKRRQSNRTLESVLTVHRTIRMPPLPTLNRECARSIVIMLQGLVLTDAGPSRAVTDTTSLKSSILKYKWENGRRYHSEGTSDSHYWLVLSRKPHSLLY